MEQVKRSLQRRRGAADLRELLALIARHEIAQAQGFCHRRHRFEASRRRVRRTERGGENVDRIRADLRVFLEFPVGGDGCLVGVMSHEKAARAAALRQNQDSQ
jgi:hypothetical protein